ncbi:MAG: VWA domain-containing protein [Polyangiaceae bacterium]|nr:VWA domain-containing protein [Polyangiaceae bacterium]MCB9605314.1 VWA domain-containing protein [Polyangiaceae bacterium]
MRPLLIGSLFLLASPLCLTVACGSSGDSAGGDGGSSFGGSGGSSAGTSNGGSSGSSNGGSAGSSSGGTTNGGSSSGGTANGGSGGSSGSAGNGGNGGVEDAGIPDVNFTYDAPIVTEDACAATRIEADPIPLDMYIVLDDSGSMGSDCNVGSGTASKWCYAVNALDSFFSAPESVGTGIALNYFNNGDNCANGLSTPPSGGSVAFNILPAHLSALRSSLNSNGPTGSTPTEAALRSIVNYTTAQAAARPGRTMVGVLITDGQPSGCSSNNTTLNNIIRNHFNNTGIPTFIIGMTGASFGSLEAWANGAGATQHTTYCGGANPCYSYNVANGNGTVFIDVLKEIQKAAVGCTFNVPTPDSGILDPNKVDVVYTPGGGGAAQTLTRVTDQSQCGTAPGQGWYYNDNTNPTQILLCPDVCTTVSADSGAKIDVELGCLGS